MNIEDILKQMTESAGEPIINNQFAIMYGAGNTMSVYFEGKVYKGYERSMLQGMNKVIIQGENFFFHRDIFDIKEAKVIRLDEIDVKLPMFDWEQDDTVKQLLQVKVESRLWP